LTSFLDGRNGVSNHFAVDANIGYADDIEDSNVLPSRYDVAGNESCVDCVDCSDSDNMGGEGEYAVESRETDDRREEVQVHMNFNLNKDAFAVAGLRENSFAMNKASDGDGKETYVRGVGGDCSFTQSKRIDGKRMTLLSCDVLI
jgi:hypothetical protein